MAIHQPHDHLFRRVFGVPQDAASFLQARLPPALRRSLRWSTLKRHPTSYVTPDLHGAASDLLFEVRYAKPGARARLWLYLLFEHQSTPDGARGAGRAEADAAAAGGLGAGTGRRRAGRH